MALADEVKDRKGGSTSQLLISLTNPRDTTATTIDDTVLTRACDDVEDAWFELYAQAAYDSTERKHVVSAVEAVIFVLRTYATAKQDAIDTAMGRVKEILSQVAKAGGARSRVQPYTTSTLDPSDRDDDSPHRSAFDSEQFEDHIPNPPEGEQSYD